jgi:hypothetical protein
MTTYRETPAGTWLDRFFAARFRHRPVDATFVGVRGHDHRLPDASPDALEAERSELARLLAEAEAEGVPDAPQHPAEPLAELDRRLAVGDLRIRLWELESRWQHRNPSAYMGEVVFGLMSLLLPASAPPEGVGPALLARMRDVDRYLSEARSHLGSAPVSWTERALRECRGGLAFLRDGLPRAALPDVGPHEVAAAARLAAGAIESFASFLRAEVRAEEGARLSCGRDAFDLLLREGHFLRRSADEIAGYAREEVERTRAWLAEAAPEYGGTTPEEVLAGLSEARPTAAGYLSRFEAFWRSARELAEERELLTWPDFPIRYVPRPEWSRAAAPDLYFLFYRSPAAYRRPPVHRYMVAPLPEAAGPEELDAFLRANNDSVIRLNHVIHHGGIGHHVQNWHAFRSPLRVGRVAAVDCASRIAMFCGGTMAEGWACYATDLMAEAGGLTPVEVFAEHAGRIRMAARAVVDVELHCGRMSLDEAVRYYIETAGMPEAAARSEAVKNSMFPGAALMYLVGTDLVHELRSELLDTLGDRFVLRDFHDAFLSYGSIPVRIIADEMLARARLDRPLDAHAQPPHPS